MKKALALILATSMVFMLLVGCGSDNPEQETNDTTVNAIEVEPGLQIYEEYLADKITIGCSGAGTSLAPQGKPVWGTVAVRDMIFQKLLRIGTDTELHLELLKDLEKIDDMTYKLTLWDIIYDTQGNHLTASDVVYSFECYLATGNAGGISRLDHFEILNDYELLWHCKEPFAIGELGRQMSNVTIFTRAAMEASKDAMVTTPIGSGPYKLKSFTPGSACVMEVDENFWMRNLPEDVREGLWIYTHQNIREVEYQVIKDASSRAIALEMGTIVAADAISQIDIEAFKSNPDITPVQILQKPPVPIIFNSGADSSCQDVNLRKAICYAIDNAAIAAGVGDYTYPIYGFQPNLYDSPAEWKTGREYYDYNLETAKEYLAKLKANLYRTESRGMHYREDYPFHNDKEWLCHVGVYKDENGRVSCRKIEIPEEWKGDLNEPHQKRYPALFPKEAETLGIEVQEQTKQWGGKPGGWSGKPSGQWGGKPSSEWSGKPSGETSGKPGGNWHKEGQK